LDKASLLGMATFSSPSTWSRKAIVMILSAVVVTQ